MKARISRPLSVLSLGAALALGPMIASAGPASHERGSGGDGMPMGMMGGDMMDGHAGMMGHGGMGGGDMMDGHAGMMGAGGMMGGDMEQMRAMMHEMASQMTSHADERIAALKTELKITEAQLPQWSNFADALHSAAVSMHGMHQAMMGHAAAKSASAAPGETNYPDWKAVTKSASPAADQDASGALPARLGLFKKMLVEHLAQLDAIKAALDPLYASFSPEQKKIADGLMVGPLGVM